MFLQFVQVCQQPVGKMSVLEERVISKNREFLQGTLDVKDLLPRLIADRLITDDDEERITKEITHQDQAKKLLRLLSFKDNWFSCFVRHVKGTQAFIAKRLLSCQKELAEEWTAIGEINWINMQQSHTLL